MARFDNKIFILTPSFPLKTCGEGVFFICYKRIRVNITPIKFNISILKFIFAEVILKAKKQGRKDFYKMKITFLGAGSTIFAKNVLGDCILTPSLGQFDIALYDIDRERLECSFKMLNNINRRYGKARIARYTDLKSALEGADFVVNAVQVGGYKPCTVTDFEVPKKYGLRQTIGDTLGIGGIFRFLRTAPVLEQFAKVIHKVCPNALFLNYTNPMAMITGYCIRELDLNAVGLCHSVQYCVEGLFKSLGFSEALKDKARWDIAGINHQAWLLKIEDENGRDMYPEIKRRSASGEYTETMAWDLVRHEIMHRFGYYNTESSEHTAEYLPYFIKATHSELIDRYKIPLDEYPRRCENQIKEWNEMQEKLLSEDLEHTRSKEFASYIIESAVTDKACRIHGNVINEGLIPNLPSKACVEVACLVDQCGIQPVRHAPLPEQCAALNRTNINVQLLSIEAARSRKKEDVYRAAYLDPHTSAELTLDEIKSLCDDLFEAHKAWLPEYL